MAAHGTMHVKELQLSRQKKDKEEWPVDQKIKYNKGMINLKII